MRSQSSTPPLLPLFSLALVLLLLLAPSYTQAAAKKAGDDPVEALITWLRGRGGEAAVRATARGSVTSGLSADRALQPGGALAVVPFTACYELPEGVTGVQEAALAVAPDVANNAHSHHAMWAALVQPKQTRASFYTFPQEYLPLLQAPALAEYVERTQAKTAAFWSEHRTALEAKGVTHDQFLELVHVISTRYFEHEGGLWLVPLMDLASHDGQCPHYIDLSPCPDPKDADEEASFASDEPEDGKPKCIYWRAGVALKPGDAVCTNFGNLLNDRSLLQFGFLVDDQPGQQPEVFGVDRRDFNAKSPWNDMYVDPLETSDGDSKVITSERARLTKLLKELKGGDKAAAAAKPVKSDAGGALLADVRRWRALRIGAVEAELERVEAWARGDRVPLTGTMPSGPGQDSTSDDYGDAEAAPPSGDGAHSEL